MARVWQGAACLGLFGDPYLRQTPYEAGGDPRAVLQTLDAFAFFLSRAAVDQAAADDQDQATASIVFPLTPAQEQVVEQALLPQLQQCKQWTEKAAKVGDAKQLQAFLREWKAFLLTLVEGQPVLVPGGYTNNMGSHCIMFVVEKVGADSYTFTVCNKGPGAEMYHTTMVTNDEPSEEKHAAITSGCHKVRVQACVQIAAIPAKRFLDMAFWSILFSLWIRQPPAEYHRVETLYDVLLPWLAGDRLLPLAFAEAEKDPAWVSKGLGAGHTPQRSNLGFCKSIVEAVRYICLRSGHFSAKEVKFVVLYRVRYLMFRRLVRDLSVACNPSTAYPPTTLEQATQSLAQISLQDSLQGSYSLASLDSSAIVCIYFASSKDPGARAFTRKLTQFTTQLNAVNKKVVVIVVSLDADQAGFAALVADLPVQSWLLVPFPEINTRKKLVDLFRVTSQPFLVVRGVDGQLLTPQGVQLVERDNVGAHYPWNNSSGFALPLSQLSISDQQCVEIAKKQIGIRSLREHERGNLQAASLLHVDELMEKVDGFIKLQEENRLIQGGNAQAQFREKVSFCSYNNGELLTLEGQDQKYAGDAAEIDIPMLGNLLEVPDRVSSIPLALAAFVRCRNLCESLLRRAADGSSSSRVTLHHEVIRLVTTLFVEVFPVPKTASEQGSCIWRQPVPRETQVKCLTQVSSLLMVLGCVWQSIEQPSRQFDSERSLAALCALSIYDALLRTPAADSPLEFSKMMEEDGGYVLAHKFCKANFTLRKTTAAMEFARPYHCVVRGRVLAYFDDLDTRCKPLFDFHMPEDKIEVKKYSTTIIFFRTLMERFNYQLIDPSNPNPPKEMEALMEWFTGSDTPMASEHPEVGMTRDFVVSVKFLVTMETKEVELMRRRVAHQNWQMWQLSFDDTSAGQRRHFFGMRGLNRILNDVLKWEVTNFRGSDQDIADIEVHGFLERKIYFGEGPVVISPSDLGALLSSVNSTSSLGLSSVITEDDIMHMNELPTFNGTLSMEESEYLMSYLTVPYARIPLVAAFFSSRDRVTYLFNPLLQSLFRAVLFEIGDWVSDRAKDPINQVPLRKSSLLLHEEAVERVFDARLHHNKCEEYLGTMNGLLLNELVHAPEAVMLPVLKMLHAIKELGEASVYSADARFILYMLKLGMDLLRYVTFSIDFMLAGNQAMSAHLESLREELKSYLFGFGLDTLEKWRRESEDDNNLQTACVIHSYIATLGVGLRQSEYSEERVSRIIGSVAYVRNWHCFGMRVSIVGEDDKNALSAEDRLVRWLQAQGINTENLSKDSMNKYLKGRPLYLKVGFQTIQAPTFISLRDGEERERRLPPGEVLEVELFDTMQVHRRAVVKWVNELGPNARSQTLGSIVRVALRSAEPDETWEWQEATGIGNSGRYVCQKTQLKLDLQTGEILWRNDELKPVPDSMTQYSDFKGIFGNKSLHCGLVTRQEHRLWVNIIGSDLELIEWDDPVESLDQGVGIPTPYEPSDAQENGDGDNEELKMYWECRACTSPNFNGDNPNATCEVCGTPRVQRAAPLPNNAPGNGGAQQAQGFKFLGSVFSRPLDPYSEEEHSVREEQWVIDLVSTTLRLLYPADPEEKKLQFTYFLPKEPLLAGATQVRLIGLDTGPKDKKEKDKMDTFKEIVAYRTEGVFHIFSLVSHGRRMFRKLIFTSNSNLALHSFPLDAAVEGTEVNPALAKAAGNPRERENAGGSLVILRKNPLLSGTEQLLPPRLLQGVIPTCLLEAFRFWMGQDGVLRGESTDANSQWFRYRVEVFINGANVTITRKTMKTSFTQIRPNSMKAIVSTAEALPPPAPIRTVRQTSVDQPPHPVVRDEDVVQLMSMGFGYAACGLALRETHSNIAAAAQWLLEEENQVKILAAESGEAPVTAEDTREQNIALLMSLGTDPSRIAAEYALEIFADELDLARAWLEDTANIEEIHRVEKERSEIHYQLQPMDVQQPHQEQAAATEDETMDVLEESADEVLHLMNLLDTSSSGKEVRALAKLLCRMEDISHILVWCTVPSSSDEKFCSIAFIEMPRLKLKLRPTKIASSGRIRLDIMDQNGWFVSDLTFGVNNRDSSKHLQRLIDATADSILIESDTKDLRIIVPNHDVYRPIVQGEPFSTLLLPDRSSLGWQQAMESRFYVYPIHSSHTFLLPPSLSSTLYLILISLLSRKYDVAMELIAGCNVDVKFTDEEKWVFDQISKTLDDRHPNACACRIKLTLGVVYSDNKIPWQLKNELYDYIAAVDHVDATCRLTLEEEKEALTHCHERLPLLTLRTMYCEEVSEDKTSSFDFKLTRNRVGGQPWMKLRLFGKSYLEEHAKKISTVRYNRPKCSTSVGSASLVDEEEAGKLLWNCAVVGDEVSGSNRGLGFLFLYECIQNQLLIRFGGDDCSITFGDLMTRFLHLKLSRWGRETVEDGEEECAPSLGIAHLALMLAHPADSWSSVPRDQESVSMMSRGANLFSRSTQDTLLKGFFEFSNAEFQAKLQSVEHLSQTIPPLKSQFAELHERAEVLVTVNAPPTKRQQTFGASNSSLSSRNFPAGLRNLINPEFPLESINVPQFITFCDPESVVSEGLPFDLTSHPAAQTVAAKDLIRRLGEDIAANARAVNDGKEAYISGVTPLDLCRTSADGVLDRLGQLTTLCERLRNEDRIRVTGWIVGIEESANELDRRNAAGNEALCRFLLNRRVGKFPAVTFDFLTSLLASQSFEPDFRSRNPFFTGDLSPLIDRVLAILVLCNRIVHLNRTTQATQSLVRALMELRSKTESDAEYQVQVKQTLQASKDLADTLVSKRYFMKQSSDKENWSFDPRFLVFEYVFDLLLRHRQVQMIDSFMSSLQSGKSRVQQMIMGAGKTTVVGPLLTFILADKTHLVTHVMPTALLEQSRQVLRGRFSNVVLRKKVFTFEFDRSVADDPALAVKLFEKLNRARLQGDVVCASPESIKSLMLKVVELLHSLEESSDVIDHSMVGVSQNIRRIRRILEDRSDMADELHRIIRLWQDGVLIMDEVDVLLHPLRSELNFPIGNKFPIDLAANRWELPIFLIDAVLGKPEASEAHQSNVLVRELHSVLADGYAAHALQRFPHLVLLDAEFYQTRMMPILIQIAMEWLKKHFSVGKMEVGVDIIQQYLQCSRAELHTNQSLREQVESGLSDSSIKLLNLARDWLQTILPHVLSKINRVSYGLLRGDRQNQALAAGGGANSQSRLLLAVPFVGKDVPSRSSEFAHPDVLIGLTILAYRYEGIRVSDLVRIVSQMKQDFSRQLGPRDQRPASAMFREWVASGLALSQKENSANKNGAGVLPLPLFQLQDSAQVSRLHFLVSKLSDVVYYYVRQHVFPSCMNFQRLKISACGHELGGSSLFASRIGFSGTPSNLLPMDLGECYYEPRSDGSIFHALTSDRIVSIERKINWTARSLLLDIARADPPYHALIDTGALITGFENEEVAAFLLSNLPTSMEGVVYLDAADRQMILLRDHNAPMPLVQCGLHASKRFTFYDQVHTTGMDIKQCVNARAVVTLGKDMTFRDYAQGAYRMRGIETGQAIHLFMIPEVENRIRHEIALAQSENLMEKAKDLSSFLLLVPAWLLINSMRMESMQLVQLSLQELHNTWRKRALLSLLDEMTDATSGGKPANASRLRRFIGGVPDKQWLRSCVDKFRVEISFAIESAVPTKRELKDVVSALVEKHHDFLQSAGEKQRVEEVRSRLSHSSTNHLSEDGSEHGDMRLTAEVVHENEAEAEEEAEEEAEQEEQKMSSFTRDDEHPIPWSPELLTNAPVLDNNVEDGTFYLFSQFQAHTECPKLEFPSQLLVSGNFFRKRWVGLGERRVKNVGLVMEWSPLLSQDIMRKLVHHLFMQLMTDQPGIAPNEAAVKALSEAAKLADAKPNEVPAGVRTEVATIIEAAPVFLVTLSLAEGETIRRMIHTNHPAFKVASVQLRTCEGELVESSSFVSRWKLDNVAASPKDKVVAIGTQCLRFFNNEMYYAPQELELLLEGLHAVPITLRHEFFECILRLRRRERHLWGDTPLAKVFTKKDEWHLLRARARLQQFQQSLKEKKRKIHLAVALRRHDENNDGRLTAEEILKCFESFQLGFSSADLTEIIGLIADVSLHEAAGGIPMETIGAAFNMTKQNMHDELVKEDQRLALAQNAAVATWMCPVCTFVNEGNPDICGACSEPSPLKMDGDKSRHAQQPQGWRCGNCTFINQPDDTACAICELGMDGQRAVPRGKWICAGEQGGCTFFNPTSTFYCEAMKISMESERMFNEIEEELPPSPSSREMRSRVSSRVMSPSANSNAGGATRLSVKDQLYSLECKVQSHEDTIQKMMSIHQADKTLLMSKIEEITERMGEELHKLRIDYQKKLNTASEEIERINKCLNVQRGHITTLQEQCQSLHKHVVQVDDDVTKLAAEVLGE
ncbi:TPA: LOW QUALITY PROTEIN: hypothetical protein N0F65_003298 [Lagenidium giganteum]|uniref:ubiquitinyl hydrolase 1 n=1 Tax=Lagenidium giganteum TaxID=4803 RepID=A0AAV2YW20_9STRA|nr:TPA: LOW QUALITY PROTEIN: hypothetical protein N0F65_003298 [Lagenidium giganteum]